MTDLARRVQAHKLFGLLRHLNEVTAEPWVPRLLDWEDEERSRRGFERRLRRANLGAFKPLADYDWSWPKKIDRGLVEDLVRLDWLATATNVVLVGPNGVGKTMLAYSEPSRTVIPTEAGHPFRRKADGVTTGRRTDSGVLGRVSGMSEGCPACVGTASGRS